MSARPVWLVLGALLPVFGFRTAPGDEPPAFAVRAHDVTPPSVEPGGAARERLTVWAPDGVQLSVRDGHDPGEGVERLGSWIPLRVPDPAGGVVWRFERATTGWLPGDHTTPALRVSARDRRGATAGTDVGGVPLAVVSPLPGDVRRLTPAPAEGPLPTPRGWPASWTVLPAVLAAGSALAWRRKRGPAPTPDHPAGDSPPPPPTLLEIMEAPPEDVGAFAAQVADAVRTHAVLLSRGVRAAHTTAEALELGAADVDGVEELLRLADGWKYGGVIPERAALDAVLARVVEALGHG